MLGRFTPGNRLFPASMGDAHSVLDHQLPDPQIPAGAFLIIGHCVWSWLLALAAGCFAAFVCRPRALAVA